MEEASSAEATAPPPVEDHFGPPHAQAVSESLQLWILIPAVLAFIGLGNS